MEVDVKDDEKKPEENTFTLLVGLALLVALVWFMFSIIPDTKTRSESATSQAIGACMDALRSRAKYPDSVNFSVLDAPRTKAADNGQTIVLAPFAAKNGLGNEVSLIGRCLVDGGQVIEATSVNR